MSWKYAVNRVCSQFLSLTRESVCSTWLRTNARLSGRDDRSRACYSTFSRTKRDNKIRYFVVNRKVEDALDLLKKSLDRTPLEGSSHDVKYLRLPPSTVCNKVLHGAASSGDRTLVDSAAEMTVDLASQDIEIYPRTVLTLLQAYTAFGDRVKGMKLVEAHLDRIRRDKRSGIPSNYGVRDFFSAMMDTEVVKKNKPGALEALQLMQNMDVEPCHHDVLSFFRLYLNVDELRCARCFISWIWFNHIYIDGKTLSATSYQDLEMFNEEYTKRLSTKASDILLDLKALQPVPDTLLAGIVGLCALDGRTGVAEEITRETESDGKSERILTVSWLQYYIWSNESKKASALIERTHKNGTISDDQLLEPVALSMPKNPKLCIKLIRDAMGIGILPSVPVACIILQNLNTASMSEAEAYDLCDQMLGTLPNSPLLFQKAIHSACSNSLHRIQSLISKPNVRHHINLMLYGEILKFCVEQQKRQLEHTALLQYSGEESHQLIPLSGESVPLYICGLLPKAPDVVTGLRSSFGTVDAVLVALKVSCHAFNLEASDALQLVRHHAPLLAARGMLTWSIRLALFAAMNSQEVRERSVYAEVLKMAKEHQVEITII